MTFACYGRGKTVTSVIMVVNDSGIILLNFRSN